MLAKHEHYYGLDMDVMLTICSRNTNVIIVWAWMAERSRTALCCPATKHREYGHKMVSGSLASAQNPTLVSKIELLQPPQNRAVTPGWREEPVSCASSACRRAPDQSGNQVLKALAGEAWVLVEIPLNRDLF